MHHHQTTPDTLTIEEVAERLGISRTLAYALAKADRLPVPVLRLGRRLVVGREALDRVLAGQTEPRDEQAATHDAA